MSDRVLVSEDSVLKLGRGIQHRYDKQRDAWVLMAPERVVVLDEIAQAVMSEVLTSQGTLGQVIDTLAAQYGAPRAEIAGDVLELIQSFTDKKFLIES